MRAGQAMMFHAHRYFTLRKAGGEGREGGREGRKEGDSH